MSEQERRRQDLGPSGGPPASGGSGGDLDAMRRASRDVVSAAHSALTRALSTDHESFNEAARIGGAE